MAKTDSSEERYQSYLDKIKQTKNVSKVVFSVSIGLPIIYSIFIIGLTWPISTFTISTSGVFGDSFGIITSLTSGLAFAGLIWSIFLQREDLALQRYELALNRDAQKEGNRQLEAQKGELAEQNKNTERQLFEATFFQILRNIKEDNTDFKKIVNNFYNDKQHDTDPVVYFRRTLEIDFTDSSPNSKSYHYLNILLNFLESSSFKGEETFQKIIVTELPIDFVYLYFAKTFLLEDHTFYKLALKTGVFVYLDEFEKKNNSHFTKQFLKLIEMSRNEEQNNNTP